MTNYPRVSDRVRSVCAIALVAAVLAWPYYTEAMSPSGRLVAECFNEQTLDPSTGTCPDDPPLVNGASDLASNPAVQDAEQGNMDDEALAGSNG